MRGDGGYVSARWSMLQIDELYYQKSNPDVQKRTKPAADGKHRIEQRESDDGIYKERAEKMPAHKGVEEGSAQSKVE